MKSQFTSIFFITILSLLFSQCALQKVKQTKESDVTLPHDHSAHSHSSDSSSVPHEHLYMAKSTEADTMTSVGIETILYTYYKMCEALSKEDKTVAADYAGSMYRAIDRINIESLSPETKLAWISRKALIKQGAMNISNAGNIIEEQRSYLSQLSLNIFDLITSINSNDSIYLFYCEYSNYGKGGNWISNKNDPMTNPYQSVNRERCGSLIEKIGMD